jgi:translation initiation factor IF-1
MNAEHDVGSPERAPRHSMRKDDVFSSAAKSQACPLACHIEFLPDARYRVQLDAGYEVVAYTSGKMKKNLIKTLAGDRVIIEMSPYDLA